jgi:tetratricopeptide (TPR) repeat protein
LRAIRFQIFFALIYYPIFTIALPIGDWRTIYDFSLTPILSGITAVFHVVLLLAHWWLNNNGYYDMVGFETVAQQEAYEKQLLLAQQQPDNLVLQDEVVSYMARGGAVKPAQRRILDLLKKNPDWADGHLTYAVTLVGDKSNFSRTAVRELEKALALGLSDNRQKAIAHNLLGKHYVNTERYDRGKQHLTEALEFAQTPPNTQTLLQLQAYYWRGEAARRQGKLTAAEADFRQALILAQAQKQTGFIEHISKLLTAMKGRPEKNEPA